MTTILTEPAAARTALAGLLQNYSFEMTAKDVPQLEEAADLIPRDTKIAITFLPNEAFPARVAAAARVRQLGFVPVPHISARRLKSQDELEVFLAALQREAAIDRAFVVAGDPPQPEGPYADALAVIRTGLLGKYGVSGWVSRAIRKGIPKSAARSCGRRSAKSRPRSRTWATTSQW